MLFAGTKLGLALDLGLDHANRKGSPRLGVEYS